ncbi:MAG TPA: HepT-like ribonuclease domain-containing protein [Roseiarcus sp.]|nr:HepT-like ribonuclease domain-containing protein [Roseiarcus sp.]
MRREADAYLRDIDDAAGLIEQFTAGRSLADYLQNPMLRAAVERQFEIIGEALAQLVKRDAPRAARIRDHRRIIAFRNILIHGYADVDNHLVWDIVVGMLPLLRRDIAALLGDR